MAGCHENPRYVLGGQRAWHVAPDGHGGYTERAIEPREWNPPG
jgi:hypothetical protein